MELIVEKSFIGGWAGQHRVYAESSCRVAGDSEIVGS